MDAQLERTYYLPNHFCQENISFRSDHTHRLDKTKRGNIVECHAMLVLFYAATNTNASMVFLII